MNVGTRYPEGRIGRPREIGGRHVRKEEKGLRKGGPEGLRKAHEARAGHGPEDAGAQGVMQGDREGAGQVALDGERRGGVAQVRDGACERNHVEIRKLLPKGAGLRFDRLSPADMALAMSHVNSEPRGALGFSTPARAFRAMLGDDAEALLDAYGVEDVPIGELDLTPGLIARARAERGDAPLS